MKDFIIKQKSKFLNRNIQSFYHADFYGKSGVGMQNHPDYLYTLKNDPHHRTTEFQLNIARRKLLEVLLHDLPIILEKINTSELTVCVVPRAKADNSYKANQLLFKATVKDAITQLNDGFQDGTNFIERHTNTKTTHLREPIEGWENDGLEPYSGISKNTCDFYNINSRNILLIDDIYTENINIDEDMIQALFDHGANSVIFYAIGKTMKEPIAIF